MPEWLFDFLSGPTIKIAEAIWNSSMRLIIKLVCSTPQKFSTGTWAFVKENLYPWAEGIGLSALNLFFMIAFLKAVSNLHQNITLEMVIEAMIKVVVANVLYLNILNIMTTIFSISSATANGATSSSSRPAPASAKSPCSWSTSTCLASPWARTSP